MDRPDLKERNDKWRLEIKEHLYPMRQQDIADLMDLSRVQLNGILTGRHHLYPSVYEKLMDIDVQLFFDSCPEYASKTKERLQKIIDEAPKASAAIRKYF